MTTFPHVRVQAAGGLGAASGNEIWSCALKVGVTATPGAGTLINPTQADVDQVAGVAEDAWTAFVGSGSATSFQGVLSNWVSLMGVTAAAVTTTGHDDPGLHSTFEAAPIGTRGKFAIDETATSPTGEIPYNVSVACTFKGDIYPKGSASHGRIYLPLPNLWVTASGSSFNAMTDGLMSAASTTILADGVAGLIAAINTGVLTLTSGHSGLVTNIGASTDLAGTRWQAVTNVVVDNRPDSVRRRYNKLSGRGKITVPTH